MATAMYFYGHVPLHDEIYITGLHFNFRAIAMYGTITEKV